MPGFPGTSVCEWTGGLAPGGSPRCVNEGSTSAMERTTYRWSLGSNALAFDEPQRDPQHADDGAAPSKTLDAETLAALMTRAKSMLVLGEIAARLLLERAANARDATAERRKTMGRQMTPKIKEHTCPACKGTDFPW